MVNDERSRLTQLIAEAQREARRWGRAAAILTDQAQAHAREDAIARSDVREAAAHLARVRNQVLKPLLARATADGRTYIDADAREHEAWTAAQAAGRLGKRGAERRLTAARDNTRAARTVALDHWGSAPDTGRWGLPTRDSLKTWAERVAGEHTDAELHVVDAQRRVREAEEALKQTRSRHSREALELTVGVYGRHDANSYRAIRRPNNARGRAKRWQQLAEAAHRDLAVIESLSVGRALQFIEARRPGAGRSEVERTTRPHPAPSIVSAQHQVEREDNGPVLGL
jgi:hypothetical protein